MPIGNTSASGQAAFHGCKVYNSTTQSINSGAAGTAVTFDTEEFDTDGFHEGVTHPTRITIPTGLDGHYLFVFASFWNSNPNQGHCWFLKNGTTVLRSGGASAQTTAGYTGPTAIITALVATDYVEAIAAQTVGSAVQLGHASVVDAQSSFAATFLG